MIQIFGCGRVGMAIAQGIVSFHLDNVTLTDIDEERLSSEYHDLNVYCKHLNLFEASTSKDVVPANVYIISCGKSRKDDSVPRESLFTDNWNIIKPYVEKIAIMNPKSWILLVTNPSTLLAKECLNYLPRVIPMGLLTDKIEEEYSCIYGCHEKNMKTNIGDEIFRISGGSKYGIAGEVLATLNQFRRYSEKG